MNSLSYLILFVILGICLIISNKEKFRNLPLPGRSTFIKVTQLGSSSLKIIWDKPSEPLDDPIKGYIVMLKNKTDPQKGFFLNFKIDQTCTENCEHIINNISLIPDIYYTIGVIAINNNGGGIAIETDLKTNPLPSPSPSPSPSSSPSSSPSPTPKSTSNPLDSYVDNMISRADGVYAWNKDVLKYPDTYQDDIKQSLKTLNDQVKTDLQEYRINVHLTQLNK